MGTQPEKITTAGGESATPPGIVPTALASQQSQGLSKARVDLDAAAAAVEAGRTQTDGTTYPGSQKQGTTAASNGSGGTSGQGAQPQGSSAPPGIVPTALSSQQSQALGKARVDLGAITAAVQGATAPAAPQPARPGEVAQVAVASDATLTGMALAKAPGSRPTPAGSSKRPMFHGYLDGVVRAATTPLPSVPAARPALIDAAIDTPLRPEGASADGGGRRAAAAPARPPPDTVAPLSLQGAPLANLAAHPAVAPGGTGAVAAAGSLGVARPARARSEAGDRLMIDVDAERHASTFAQNLTDQGHAAALADEWKGTAAVETERGQRLAGEAGRLRTEAAARRSSSALSSAARLDERARELQRDADRHMVAAARAGAAEQHWIRRLEDLRGEEPRLEARLNGLDGLSKEAALADVARQRPRTPHRCGSADRSAVQ